jgi:hypothetical protein
MVRKALLGIIAIGVIILLFKYCGFKDDNGTTVIEESALIREQLRNVSKLVVTEGHFSEVLTYRNTKKGFLNLFDAEKKAIVIVNAEVTVGYDLSQIKYDVDEAAKTITIVNIPKEEIKISPDLKYYDVEQNGFNEFSGDDYNKISKQAKESIAKKIEKSSLKSNAQNRLVSELGKILILTNSMGWTLKYNGQQIDNQRLNDGIFQ